MKLTANRLRPSRTALTGVVLVCFLGVSLAAAGDHPASDISPGCQWAKSNLMAEARTIGQMPTGVQSAARAKVDDQVNWAVAGCPTDRANRMEQMLLDFYTGTTASIGNPPAGIVVAGFQAVVSPGSNR